MSDNKTSRKPFNKIVIVGMWSTIAVLLFWAGGEAFKKGRNLHSLGSIFCGASLALGLLIQFRKPKEELPKQ